MVKRKAAQKKPKTFGDFWDEETTRRVGMRAATWPAKDLTGFMALKVGEGSITDGHTIPAVVQASASYGGEWIKSGPQAKQERTARLLKDAPRWIDYARDTWAAEIEARRSDPDQRQSTKRKMAEAIIEHFYKGKSRNDTPARSLVEDEIARYKPRLNRSLRKNHAK